MANYCKIQKALFLLTHINKSSNKRRVKRLCFCSVRYPFR